MTASVPMSELARLMEECLGHGGTAVLPVTGGSMLPMLRGGRDSVRLARPDRPLSRGDVALYRRENGRYVLHRLVRELPDGAYLFCGDNQWSVERVEPSQVVAVMLEFERAGRIYGPEDHGYRLYTSVWTGALPARRFTLRFRRLLGRAKRRLRAK